MGSVSGQAAAFGGSAVGSQDILQGQHAQQAARVGAMHHRQVGGVAQEAQRQIQ